MRDLLQINYVWCVVKGRHWHFSARDLKLIIHSREQSGS